MREAAEEAAALLPDPVEYDEAERLLARYGITGTRADQDMACGFTRHFATADGERVMVAALTRQQFADLVRATRLVRTFAFLERVLTADFSATDDLHTYQSTIAALLAPWFARRTIADLTAALAGISVAWSHCPG
jgi:2-methylfumaryl-CoA isomerase